MVAPLLSNPIGYINRIANDTGNPRLSAELQDAILDILLVIKAEEDVKVSRVTTDWYDG